MAINDNQKLDFLWKKLGYGVTKTDINSIKNATNESIPSSLLIRGDKLWAEAGDIPATIPTSNTSQVELTSTETTSDLTASANRTWKTSAADWIPPEFGSTYQVKVYIDSAGAANPQSTGTQLFAAGSGNNDEWFFDYQSGVLNFIGDNLPSGISGNKIYVVGARYIGNFGISGTSDGIIEGSNNLYYTDERVDDRVADLIVDGVGITKNYDDAGNLLDISINFTEFDSDDIVEGAVNTFLASRSTDAIPEGSTNLYYTDARTDARISLQSGSNLDLSNKTTTDLAEGTNLYFTDERVDDRVANLIQAGANISLVYDDIAGTLTISATEDNLANNTTDDLVEGSTNLYYTDARVQTYLTNNSYATIGTVTQQVAAQVGAIVSDLDDEIYDREQGDLNLQSQIDSIVTYSSGDFDTDFSAKTTTDLAEGTNLYYTDARFDTRLAAKSTTDVAEGTNLYYTQARFDSAFTAKSSTDLSEGTNLYYTEERVDDRVAALIQDGVGITKNYDDAGNLLNISIDFAEFDSDDIVEGAVNTFLASRTTDAIPEGSTNLYYTDARADARIALQSGSNLDLSSKDTDDLSEGSTNLYYTDVRVDTNFATKDTGDLAEGSNLYYTQARFNTAFAAKSTTDLSEGTNLYYTDIRTDARIALQSGSNLDLSSKDTDELSEGSTNLYYTEARVDANIATKDTGDITEGSNLYYTNTRVQTKLGSVSGHIIPDTDVTYDLGSTSNKFRDLYLSGSSITLGSIELSDNGGSLEVTPIGGGSTETFATETYVDTAVANLVDTAPTTLDTLNELAAALGDDPNFSTTITNLIGTKLATADFNTTADTWIGTKSTTDLTEGSNLYYTDSRVDARITLQSGSNLDLSNKDTDDLSEGSTNLYYTDARVNSAFDTRLATKSTTDLAEGTNLYYTDTRVRAAISVTGDLTYDSTTGVISTQGLASSDTDDLSEGSANLYYTDARVQTYLTNNSYAKTSEIAPIVTQQVAAQIGSVQSDLDDEIYDREQGDLALQTQINSIVTYSGSDFDTDFAGKSTTDLTEGTNLYYTDARVSTYLSTNGFATETYVDNAVSNLIDTAPTTLDTLNELAAALNDDPNFSTTITNLIGTKLATADFNTTADTWIGTKSTTDLSEGTNLYYTEARVDARIALQSGSNLDLSNKDTDDLSEGSSNLYYTDSRADARVNLQTGANLDLSNKSTTNLVEGTNLYYTDARVDARISSAGLYTSSDFNTDFSGKSTTDLTEGTNLYYTDARVAAYLATTSFTTTTYVNSQIAIVNSNLDDEIYNREQADISLQTQISAISSYTTSDFNTDFATKDTDDLSEGSTNLYYTDARVDARITAAGSVTQSDIDSAIAALIDSAPGTLDTLNELAAALGDDANFSTTITNSIATKLAISDFNSTADTWLTGKSTSNLSEGTNLYYTDARVDARITASNPYTSADFDTDFSGKSTTDLAEGTNLYYTQARFDSALSSKSTTDLSEGNNLYYTDARVDARITNAGLFDGDYNSLTNLPTLFDGQFSSLTGKPTTLAGYGITDGVSTSNVTAIVTQQVAAQTGAIQSDLDDEIYDREQADIGLQNQINGLSTYTSTDFNTDFAAKSTTDLIEGTNLYYTDSRVASYLSNQGITSETTTTLSINGNILTYTDEDGTTTNIDLSLYIDDTNLARLTSGSLAANGIATFTRDDASTFTIDFSQFFDDTNLSRIDSATFANGTLTLTRNDASTAATINLDGRYLQNFVAQTTDDLSEGSTNLYYTQARFDSAFTAKSTTDLSEGTNLYYTDARVRGQLYSTVSVTTSGGKFYIDGEQQSIATLQPGRTYRFDQSAASNNSHPLRFSEIEDGTHAGGGATEYTTGVTVNGTAGNAGAYVEIVVTNATPRLYYYCANHTGMGGKVSVGKELFVERITSDTWITGPIQTTTVNVGTGGQINAQLATLDFTNTTVNFSGATIAGLSNSDVGLANIADNAQGVVVNGKVAAGSLDLGTGGQINAVLTTVDFSSSTVVFSGATVVGLDDTVRDEVDFHLNKNNSSGQTIISDGQILSWNSTGGLQGTGDYEWVSQSATGASVTTSSTAPTSPNDGDLWFDTDELKTYVYYNDGTSSQWVQSNPTGAIGGGGTSIEISDVAPTSPSAGDLWFDSDALKTFIYYDDGSGAQWIESSGGSSISDTDALFEGSTNLYYTDARVDTHLNVSSATNGQTLIWNGTDYSWGTPAPGYTSSDFDTDFATKSTTDVVEGTNLYYTDARVQTKLGDVSGHIIPDTDVTYDLGSSTHKFRDLYLSGNSIILGGITLTESSGSLLVTPTAGGANNTFATEIYVDTAISNLVDTAPTTLDTLNELAAALGDDPNFATTITNLIGTKLATADFNTTADSWLTTKSTTNLSEGTNLYYTDARFDTRLSTKTTDNLTEGSTNLYYTDARADARVAYAASGALSVTYTPTIKYARLELTANQSISSTTQTILNFNTRSVDNSTANLLTTTLGSGKFIIPAGVTKVRLKGSAQGSSVADQFLIKIMKNGSNAVTTNFDISSTGSDFPAVFTGIESVVEGDYFQVNAYSQGSRTVNAGSLTWFELEVLEGSILDTTVSANVALADLNNVSNAAPADGQALIWNTSQSNWAPANVAAGGSTVSVSDTAPSSPSNGDQWFNSADGSMYVYYTDGSSNQWVSVSGPAGSSVSVGTTPPTGAASGDQWFNSNSATLYVYYADGSSSQWVAVSGPIGPTGPAGADGSSVTVYANIAAFPSSGNTVGDFAFASDTKALYVWDGAEWDRISSGPQIGPRYTTTPTSAVDLSTSGVASTLTAVAVDESGFPITYDWDAYSGSTVYNASSLPPQLTAVSESNGVFTLTPSTSDSDAGVVTFRTKASDGVLFTPAITTLTLTFGLENITGFVVDQTSYGNYAHTVWNALILNSTGAVFEDATLRSSTTVAGYTPTTNVPEWGSGFASNAHTDAKGIGLIRTNATTAGFTVPDPFYTYFVSEGTANDNFSVQWTSGGVTGQRFYITGWDKTNNNTYFNGGQIKFYINGVLESNWRSLTTIGSGNSSAFYIDLMA